MKQVTLENAEREFVASVAYYESREPCSTASPGKSK